MSRKVGTRELVVGGAGYSRGLAETWVGLTASIVACMLVFAAARAEAGSYVINNCPSAGNGNAGSWTVFGSPQNVKGTCSGGVGDYIGPRGGSMSPGALAGVQIGAPSGITIREAKIWWQVSHQVSGADTFAIAADNGGVVGESTTPLGAGNPDTFVLSSTTTELTLANYCSNDDAGAGCTFGGGEKNILELYGAQLTLFDSGLPSGSVTGGSLSGAGPVSGTQSLAYNAADGGSGVRYVEVVVDGHSVAKNDYIAECPYQNFAACPANVSGTISWNTSTVTDGSHDLALRVVNAGGNSSIVDDHTITTHNSPSISSPPTISEAEAEKVEREKSENERIDRERIEKENTGASGTNGANGSNGSNGAGGGGGTAGVTVVLPGSNSSLGSVLVGTTARWALSLTVSPLRVHRGTTIRLTGKVSTSPRPGTGKLVFLQARSVSTRWKGSGRHRVSAFGKWMTFQEFRASSNGSFSSSYTFKLGGHHTYQFQAVAPAEGQFRNPSGTSRAVTVREG
jgi:hypothetical protein